MMTFTTYTFADVSTAYFAKSDLPLLLDPAIEYHLANEDDSSGSFFYIPDDEGCLEDAIPTWRAQGLSERFIEIVRALSQQGIRYVRLQADGLDIEGLELHPDNQEAR